MAKITVSFIATIFNEEKTISRLLDSVLSQSALPEEVIIVDGGSTDETENILKEYSPLFKEKEIKYQYVVKKGNRSVGRNEAIKRAKNPFILISDAGCELEKNWVKEMKKSFEEEKNEVVAGYYQGKSFSAFQEALIPFVLVMPDRVDESHFLPATRSMGIKKKVWEKSGGFGEKYSHNEDYEFANRLKKNGVSFVFNKRAIVYWYPRTSIKQSFIMFWRFAYGDAESGVLRTKVILLFIRYLWGVLLVCAVMYGVLSWSFILILLLFYSLWAGMKNNRYIKGVKAFFWLIFLQYVADFAVLSGTIGGTIKRWDTQKTQ